MMALEEQPQQEVIKPDAPRPVQKEENGAPSNEKATVDGNVPKANPTSHYVNEEPKQGRAFCSPILVFFSTLGSLFAGMITVSAIAGQSMSQFYWHIPILYGDKSTREWPEITGFKSGCAAGGKSLFYGFYDGITGIITLPYKGARGAGLKGFGIGILHGFGGLLFKPLSGIWAFIGHPIFGLHQHISNRKNKSEQQRPSSLV
ncbi:hypothetical protein NUW58_g6619 [Xylaria curta]|uniref:Uncharacterized protein n=1 Tax=Xylaria curta TaxID=42375 RepID=A0ACC1NQY9_9PEZI|nr:hypothetical protein NUW58_g6619 [Xylaria curta]